MHLVREERCPEAEPSRERSTAAPAALTAASSLATPPLCPRVTRRDSYAPACAIAVPVSRLSAAPRGPLSRRNVLARDSVPPMGPHREPLRSPGAAHLTKRSPVYSACRIWLFQWSLCVMKREPPERLYAMRPRTSHARYIWGGTQNVSGGLRVCRASQQGLDVAACALALQHNARRTRRQDTKLGLFTLRRAGEAAVTPRRGGCGINLAPRAATLARRKTRWPRESYPARCRKPPPPPPA